MGKICISIEGINGVGKTTLIKEYSRVNQKIQYVPLTHLHKLESYDWWFHQSKPKELINDIFSVMLERYQKMIASDYQIIIIDKGIKTFAARIYANFRMRNIDMQEIEILMEYYYSLCKAFDSIIEYSVILNSKFINNFDTSFFEQYNNIQEEYLTKLNFNLYISNQSLDDRISHLDSFFASKFLYHFSARESISIKTLDLDNEIIGVIKCVYDKAIEVFNENLCLFALVGSYYHKSQIKNWSDVDFLLILKENSDKRNLSKIIPNVNIHVGISCFSIQDLYNNRLDLKSNWNIWYIQNKIISPLYSKNFDSLYIDKNELLKMENSKIKEVLFI